MIAPMTNRSMVLMLPQIDLAFAKDIDADEAHLSALIEKAIKQAVMIARPNFPKTAELSFMIAGDDLLQELNNEYRHKDKPTNVLSFPSIELQVGEAAEHILGDIVISLDTTKREAALENKSFDDHFSHLVIHGFLHLFGYDHETDTQALQMERLETRILAELGIADPYEN